nr:exocyst complex component SEC3A-like isoform X2 [Tanacetum cinerariifolium]
IQEAEIFSEMLKRELHALELANVHVLQGLVSATICTKVMDEWLALFNVKLRHMREDIEVIETRNNKLEMQSINYKSLVTELESFFPTPLRKSYYSFINQLLWRETREFANELQVGTKLPKVQSVWFEGSSGPNTITDTSMIFEVYSKMLAVFVPLLVDEISFLSFFMRFEGSSPNLTRDDDEDKDDDDANDEDLDMDIDENDANKIPFQVGLSKSDLRKVVQSSLSGIDKHITAMHKKLMKNLTSEELVPTL